jgi:hypothetical protein
MKRWILALLTLSLISWSPAAAKDPTGTISVTLNTFAGNEGGYGSPKIGSKLSFSVSELPKMQMLTFGSQAEYVPLVAPFKIVDVDWHKDRWDSLRAVSEDSRSKVTLDLQKFSATNQIRCWIVVESRNRTRGVLYCEGTYR